MSQIEMNKDSNELIKAIQGAIEQTDTALKAESYEYAVDYLTAIRSLFDRVIGYGKNVVPREISKEFYKTSGLMGTQKFEDLSRQGKRDMNKLSKAVLKAFLKHSAEHGDDSQDVKQASQQGQPGATEVVSQEQHEVSSVKTKYLGMDGLA